MMCPHCEIGSYFGTCKCMVANAPCPFMRRCNMEHRWLPLDSMNTCTRRTREREVSMLMADEYRVEFESKGRLYVNINGQIERIENPFNYTPEKVKIVFVEDKPYVKGYEPERKVAEKVDVVEIEKEEKKSKKESKKKGK